MRSLRARHGPASGSRKHEQRRSAKTARAATATSARDIDALSGCGAGIAAQRKQNDVTGWQCRARGALTRRGARAGAEIATGRAASTRHDGAGGNGDVGAEGRGALGLRRGDGSTEHARCGHGGGGGAREARSLGARQEPAPSSRKSEQRRHAKTARAATAASARKVGALWGGGAVTGSAAYAG